MNLGVSEEHEELRASVRRFLADRAPISRVRALEVNPLWVNGDQVEALDVLVITEPDGSSGTE